jgi:hypothetical protein
VSLYPREIWNWKCKLRYRCRSKKAGLSSAI